MRRQMTTMIADPPLRTSLGVGFNGTRGRAADTEAWKQRIGNKPIPARLALLPEPKPTWDRVGVSAIFQMCVLGFFLLVPMLYPEGMKTAIHYYSSTPITEPVTEIPVAPPPAKVQAVVPKVEVKPDPIEPEVESPAASHLRELCRSQGSTAQA